MCQRNTSIKDIKLNILENIILIFEHSKNVSTRVIMVFVSDDVLKSDKMKLGKIMSYIIKGITC